MQEIAHFGTLLLSLAHFGIHTLLWSKSGALRTPQRTVSPLSNSFSIADARGSSFYLWQWNLDY